MLKAELRVFKLKKTHMAGKSLFQHFCKVSNEILCPLINYSFVPLGLIIWVCLRRLSQEKKGELEMGAQPSVV